MQRNKSNEIARDIIRTAKETFNERINNISLRYIILIVQTKKQCLKQDL